MNAWPFVIAAYALALGGTGALLAWSWHALQRAEHRADEGRER